MIQALIILNINISKKAFESFLLRCFNINRRPAAINCFGMELNKLAQREV